MIGVVVFKSSSPAGKKLLDLLSSLEEVEVRGIGRVYRYEMKRRSLYFVPLPTEFSFNAEFHLKRIVSGLGRPSFVLSLYPPEAKAVFLHATGNVTSSNPLLHPSFTPRSVSPVDGDFLGTLYLALKRSGVPVSVVAVHDPPSSLSLPHIAVRLPSSYVEDFLPAVIAAFRRKKIFVPYVTVSRSYTADYFSSLFEGRRISAYHVPFYWSHFLDVSLFSLMVERGRVRKILVEKGLVLPGELPQEEV